LKEALETIEALHHGGLDAIVRTPKNGSIPRIGVQLFHDRVVFDQHHTLLDAIAEGAVMIVPEGTIVYCNAAFALAVGKPLEETLGADFRDFIQPGDTPRFDALLARARDGTAREEFNLTTTAEGGYLATQLSLSFARVDHPGSALMVVTDLTDRKRAERELAVLAEIVNASEDAIVSVSREFTINSWNAAAERAYGFTASETVGNNLKAFVSPAEFAETVAKIDSVFATGRSASLVRTDQKADGPRFISVKLTANRDRDGNIMSVAGIGRDITRLKQIEDELREAHEYCRGLIDSAIDAMVAVDREMRIIDGNEHLARLTEIPKKGLLGSPFEGYFADHAAARSAIEQTFNTGSVSNVELVVMTAGGREIPISFNASLFYKAGEVAGLFGVARDITQQRAILRTLHQEREYNLSLVRSSPDGLLVCDSDLVLTDANERVAALTGYARNDLVGIRLPSLFVEAGAAQDLLEKTSQEGWVHEAELQLVSKFGREIPVSLNAAAFMESGGPARRIVAFVRDITERKRAEKERSLLAAIVESSGNAIFSEACDLTITSWNPAAEKLFGYSAKEAIGRSAALLAPLDRRGEILRYTQSVRLSGRPESYETMRVRKDGSVICVAVTQSPVLDPSGVVAGLSVTATDIGDRKRMEGELARARDAALEGARQKSEFLANMSHEIRTPLNAIIGMSGLLFETELSSEQGDFAHDIQESGNALLSLINDILDYSKIAAGKLVLEEIDFDLTRVIESATELVADQARRKGLELMVSIDAEVPRNLRGDPGRLRQILINLLGNAIKFTEQGEIVVAVSKLSENPKEAMLRLEVRDTGIGIPKERQHLLFQPFSQVDASTTRNYGGTGLGLSIVRELVHAMLGTVAVSSAPSAGSMFWFTIKVGTALTPVEPAAERFTALIGTRILIVDDNANSRRILERQLSARGMLVTTAGSAQEALSLMRATPVGEASQIVLLDVIMPGIDGIELAHRIKADPMLAQVAVVLASSGGSRSDYSLRLSKVEIAGWLMKPTSELSLCHTLVRALASQSSAINVMAPKEKHAVKSQLPAVKLSGAGKLKVLLAEDNPVNRKVATLQLRKFGVEVDTATNGREAVEAAALNSYDLILMDCQMPEMDGYDATREIRQQEAGQSHTFIVAMTAHALPGDREKCLVAGMDDYLSKPVVPRALEAKLTKLFPTRFRRPLE
jgi:two-component system sensor histidine kinase/response regulator